MLHETDLWHIASAAHGSEVFQVRKDSVSGDFEKRSRSGPSAGGGCAIERPICSLRKASIRVAAIGAVKRMEHCEFAAARDLENDARIAGAAGVGGSIQISIVALNYGAIGLCTIRVIEVIDDRHRSILCHSEHGAVTPGSIANGCAIEIAIRGQQQRGIGTGKSGKAVEYGHNTGTSHLVDHAESWPAL